MRLYWELLRLSFQRQFAYRAANYAGMATNLFFGLLRASVLIALYHGRHEVAGITLQGAVTYTALTQAIIAFLHLFGLDIGVMRSIYSGEVATDLLKPINFYALWMAREFGSAVVSLLLRGVVILSAYAAVFPIVFPKSVGQTLLFLLSLTLGWVISFSWRFFVNCAAFWTPDARGVGRMGFGVAVFLCGFIMPLRFFPAWFVNICNLTPFPSMCNTVIEVYLGLLTGPALALAIMRQALWAAALTGLCHLTVRVGVRRLVIQGG